MTETDNPQVKEHLGQDPKSKGQLLKRIEELDDNTREQQEMFESREIKPVVRFGVYDVNTQKYELEMGNVELKTHTISTDTTSAAATTWTVTTGKRWIVYYIGISNSNRNFGASINIGGTVRSKSAAATLVQGNQYPMLGNGFYAVCTPLVLAAGTAIILTDLAFVAADVVSKTIIYREVNA